MQIVIIVILIIILILVIPDVKLAGALQGAANKTTRPKLRPAAIGESERGCAAGRAWHRPIGLPAELALRQSREICIYIYIIICIYNYMYIYIYI